ncbi:hypothetical protein IGI04_007314 [Brassica rapa subsp. trilocularis]|uniref:Uncharacterized protein n=1 Tax=Brassica rapa subsp. trilocularis TaxID=1813537 RepID=A0ABQ7NLP6_BRACM|nr:hypothetical protein IGI04_007314 [Brassica rapa subsp. trilocularis]
MSDLEESDDFGAFWRYLEKAPGMTIEHDHRLTLKRNNRSMFTSRIEDPRLIAACHCGAEYETDYSASIETHTATSIDSAHKKSIDIPVEELVNSNLGDWENDYYNPTMVAHTTDTLHTEEYDEDYEEEHAIEYKAILDEEDRLLHHSSWKRNAPSIDRNNDHHHESYAVETTIHEPRAYNLFIQQHNSPSHQQRVTNEFYDTAGGVDDRFKQNYRQHTQPRFHWEKKDEYGVYRDDHGHARDVDRHIIRVFKDDVISLLERALMDEHIFLCLPEHARLFTQTKLVPEIYTKDEINEMFYGAQENNEGDFQMKLDGVYYPLNDSISWLTTCMEEMRQDIAKIQTQRAAEATATASIDRHNPTSIDDDLTHSNPIKSQLDSYTRAKIDKLVEGIYKTLETTEERIDRRCADIYFPMDLTMKAPASIDRRNNKSTDNHRRTSVDEATNRGRLVPKVKSDMSNTHNHVEEISDDVYATLMRHHLLGSKTDTTKLTSKYPYKTA